MSACPSSAALHHRKGSKRLKSGLGLASGGSMLQNQCSLVSGAVELRREGKSIHTTKSALPEVLCICC